MHRAERTAAWVAALVALGWSLTAEAGTPIWSSRRLEYRCPWKHDEWQPLEPSSLECDGKKPLVVRSHPPEREPWGWWYYLDLRYLQSPMKTRWRLVVDMKDGSVERVELSTPECAAFALGGSLERWAFDDECLDGSLTQEEYGRWIVRQNHVPGRDATHAYLPLTIQRMVEVPNYGYPPTTP